MFNFFKRSAAPASKPVTPRKPRKPAPAPSANPALADPVPVPEVLEGNEQTDWALWEDSMTVLDSQMQSLTPSARIYEREKEKPSEYQDIDAFAGVHRKSR